MANNEHIEIIKQGVIVWNQWRTQNPEIKPDLSGFTFHNIAQQLTQDLPDPLKLDLSKINLSGANLDDASFACVILEKANLNRAHLNEADLIGSYLEGATLVDANLYGACLTNVCLTNADLRDANLTGAMMYETDLTGADLRGARLNGAHLNRANLSHANLFDTDLAGVNLMSANLEKAILSHTYLHETNFSFSSAKEADFDSAIFDATILGDTDLMNATGLDTCEHHGPSILDNRTLTKSGSLPLNFLRGCGLPDIIIDYLPTLFNQAIQFYSCFISYSSKDQEFVERLHADLQNKGVRCWFAPMDLKIGDRTRVVIDESIRKHDKLLLVLSKHSVKSEWVEKEVETAMELEHRLKRTILFPIRLDNTVMKIESGWPADIRRTRNIGDFRKWKDHEIYQKTFQQLMRDLKPDDDDTNSV